MFFSYKNIVKSSFRELWTMPGYDHAHTFTSVSALSKSDNSNISGWWSDASVIVLTHKPFLVFT